MDDDFRSALQSFARFTHPNDPGFREALRDCSRKHVKRLAAYCKSSSGKISPTRVAEMCEVCINDLAEVRESLPEESRGAFALVEGVTSDSMLYLFERCCASPETRALALSLLESKRDGMRTSLIPSIDKWRIQRQQLLEIEPLVVTGAKAKRRAKAGGDKKAEHGKPNRTAATKVIKSMVKKNATSKQIQRELDRLGLMKKSAAYELIKNLSGC